jgi:hypothetical protein
MAATCVSPIKASVIRLIKLDSCGVPVTGASSAVSVFKGFTQVSATPDYEEGEEFILKNASGELCVNEKDPNSLKRVGLEVEVCTMDPDLQVIASGERLLTTGAPATGTGVAYGEGQLTSRFSLELWQPIAGAGACTPGGVPQYVYWLFGNVGNTMIGDFTFENGTFTFTFSAETKAWSTLWPLRIGALTTGLGTNTMLSDEHFLWNITTVAPPTAVCGAVLIA